MKRTKKTEEAEVLEKAALTGRKVPGREEPEYFDFEGFEFKTIEDFKTYNEAARRHNRLCLHDKNKIKVKIPDESFHKKVRVKFQRFDQPQNVLKARVRNSEIDWKGQLKGGGTYELPVPVVKFLNNLAEPIFAEVQTEHGSATHSETKQVGERSRFACNVLDL